MCKITWNKNNPLDMASQANFRVTKMTGNGVYPTPPTPMVDVTGSANLLIALFPTRLGDAGERTAFGNAADDLDTIMHGLATYSDDASGGNKTKLIGGGWTTTKDTREKAVITGPVVTVKLTPIAGGGLKIGAKKPVGCKKIVYVLFTGDVVTLIIDGDQLIIPDGAKGVRIVPEGTSNMTLTGFSLFPSVSVVAYSVNAAGISAASGVFFTKIL